VLEALKSRERVRLIETEKLRVYEHSVAGSDLLRLAVKHDDISIMRLEFVIEDALPEHSHETSLQELADEAGDRRILELLAVK
jgi:hypothetical protein